MKQIATTIFALLMALLVGSCAGGGSSPADVVEGYLKAVEKGDVKKALTYVDNDNISPGEIEVLEKFYKEIRKSGYVMKDSKVLSEEIAPDGMTGVVKTESTIRQSENHEFITREEVVDVVKVDGKWKLKSIF